MCQTTNLILNKLLKSNVIFCPILMHLQNKYINKIKYGWQFQVSDPCYEIFPR